MTTRADLRAKLNFELGVDDDTETKPWSQAFRNSAISDGYAELWRQGVWKPVTQTVATVDQQWSYALSSIREVWRVDLTDSASQLLDVPPYTVQDDGSGAWQLYLGTPLVSGYSMVVRGWAPYKSVFTNDADTDDLPAEYNRIPLLKAKAILYRAQLSRFARYQERRAIDPAMNVSVDQLATMIAAAEQEFAAECKKVAARRPHVMQASRGVTGWA